MDFNRAYESLGALMSEGGDPVLAEAATATGRHGAKWPPPVTYQSETFASAAPAIRDCIARHWEEVALWRDKIALAPDWGKYERGCAAGAIVVYTARFADALSRALPYPESLLGYALFIVGPHLHYKNDVWATNDIYWVEPSKRGLDIATSLFDFADADLKARGVAVVRVNAKPGTPADAFLRKRYGCVEIGYGKCLK